MKVSELIAELSKYSEDWEVGVDYDSFWADPARVAQYDANSVIIKFT